MLTCDEITRGMTAATTTDHHVSAKDADEFCLAVDDVLRRLSWRELRSVHLCRRSELAISFSNDWEPFIGHTFGFNNSTKPTRLAITRTTAVLSLTEEWLKKSAGSIRGGRVFLSRTGIRRNTQTLGSWNWDAECPVIQVQRTTSSLESQLVDEAWQHSRSACEQAWEAAAKGDAASRDYYHSWAREYLGRVDCERDFQTIRDTVDSHKQMLRDFQDSLNERTTTLIATMVERLGVPATELAP
jgi:hypothetical protein